MRKAIHLLKKERVLFLSDNQDPIPAYLKFLAESASNKKTTRAYAKAQDYLRRQEKSKKNPTPEKAVSERPSSESAAPARKRTLTY
jgi:hypothetical protein